MGNDSSNSKRCTRYKDFALSITGRKENLVGLWNTTTYDIVRSTRKCYTKTLFDNYCPYFGWGFNRKR